MQNHKPFKLSGFTDEVSSDLSTQIKITKELGWEYISARTIGDKNIHDISNDEFEKVCDRLDKSGLKVAEFGSLIGNWSKKISSDWDITLGEIERCITRMKRLDVQYVRVMSYAQEEWGADQKEEKRFARMRAINQMFNKEGLTAVHENCMNWGGFSADHTLKLLKEVPDLQLVFDTGNPIFQKDRSLPGHQWQDAFDFYQKIKHAIAHVHIKDANYPPMDSEEPEYTFPGEGDARLDEILNDLLSSGYKGFIAIEPHMGKVFHESTVDDNLQYQYDVYLEYGRRLEAMLKAIG